MRHWVVLLAVGSAFAQGADPKAKPDDYPVHGQAQVDGKTVGIGGLGIGIGQPHPTQIPGTPIPGTTPREPPEVPNGNPSGQAPRHRDTPQDLVLQTAAPEGEVRRFVNGSSTSDMTGRCRRSNRTSCCMPMQC